ncbi:MAG: chorismate mutase [Alphaproteobacteria bacterium]|jgi:chorismate mutase/prephenate dehydratase
MDAGSGNLDALRREIDEIDDTMHDLLIRRAEIVRRIGALKGADNPVIYRPEREAQLLRRLIARHRGELPVITIVRVWREILTASTRLQGDFSLAVWRSEDDMATWQLARSHFGGDVPAVAFNTYSQVINAVTRGEAAIGLLPVPQQDDATPWWPTLLGEDVPRVISRLPFLDDNGAGNATSAGAFVLARAEAQPSGDDRSLVVLEIESPVSRGKVVEALVDAGFDVGQQIVQSDGRDTAAPLHLLDIAGYVRADDARLSSAGMLLGVTRIVRLGGYAVPVAVGG